MGPRDEASVSVSRKATMQGLPSNSPRRNPSTTLGVKFLQNFMAKKSMIIKANRKPKFSSRTVRRCFKCGRPRGFMRDFNLCRICFREEALEGNIPGIKKSSW